MISASDLAKSLREDILPIIPEGMTPEDIGAIISKIHPDVTYNRLIEALVIVKEIDAQDEAEEQYFGEDQP